MDPAAVEQAWRAGRARFPAVDLPIEVFRRAAGGPRAIAEHGGDLYLATACAHGVPAAHAELHAMLRMLVAGIVGRLGPRAPEQDEVLARVAERLVVPREGAPARIARYDGSHALGAWMRVIAVRVAVDMLPSSSRERPLEESVLENLRVVDGDPELLALGEHDAALVRSVIEQACRRLDRRSRRMVRHALVERLTIDEIGTLHGVHRSNAARAVRKAIDTLVANARAELTRLGGPQRTDLPQLEVSLERWLRSTTRDA